MIETYLGSNYQKLCVNWLARFFLKCRLTPNSITLMAGILGILAALCIAWQKPLTASGLLLLSGYCDTLDGTLARLSNQATPQGSVLDICVDRFVEFAIIKVDGKPTASWQDVTLAFVYRIGDKGTIALTTRNRQGRITTHQLELKYWPTKNYKFNIIRSLGVRPYRAKTIPQALKISNYTRYSLLESLKRTFKFTWTFTYFYLLILGKLFIGKLPLTVLGGPISLFEGIFLTRYSFSLYLKFLGIVSIGLGIINLLPLPGLDGGQIVLTVVEAIRRRSLSLAALGLYYRLGIILIAVLLVQVTMNDLVRLFG